MKPFNQSADLQDALDHCSQQAKKIKHLVKSVNTFAKQAQQQAEKVEVISGQTAQHLSTHLDEILSQDDEDRSTNSQASNIQSKLKKILALSADKTASTFQKELPSGSYNKLHPPSKLDTKLPMLPTMPLNEYTSSEEASDTESEYFPDWSSADSFTSERSYDNMRLGESCNHRPLWSDHFEDVFYGDEEVLRLSDEDFEDLFDDDELELSDLQNRRRLSGGHLIEKSMGLNQHVIMPAAGNDEPGSSGLGQFNVGKEKDGSDDVGSNKSTASEDIMTPQAVRRVKSMVLHNDLEDGMAVGKRMFVLQQKRNNDATSSSVPSPLLSIEDVTSLKKSLSQTSARYRLKRSRSNISLSMTPFKRGEAALKKPVDVIPEEEGEDFE